MAAKLELRGQTLGFPITVTALPAGDDWSVTVLGGCAPHVGSVSLAEYEDGEVKLRTLTRVSHRDQVVGDRFAEKLAGQEQCAVCVSCGIHYENPDRTDLERIVACADGLLERLCGEIRKERPEPERPLVGER